MSNRRNDRAFSLIELVIVVVIIGIIAAIAIPRLSRGVEGATESAIRGDLAVVRGAIDLYVTEHIGDPPTLPSFESQMTQYSDLNGNTSAVKVSPFIYGPYLRAIPDNPYYAPPATATSNAVATGDLVFSAVPRAISASGAGWRYYDGAGSGDPVFWANTNTLTPSEKDL